VQRECPQTTSSDRVCRHAVPTNAGVATEIDESAVPATVYPLGFPTSEFRRDHVRKRTTTASKPLTVAIVTGASQGIGAGLVAGYRGAGYVVIAVARSLPASKESEYIAVAATRSLRSNTPHTASA
jgi:hypothetical protein